MRSRSRHRLVVFAAALATAAAVLLPAARARAYVRYRHPTTQMPFFWKESCTPVTVYLNGYQAMTPNEIAKSVSAAAHTWSPSEVVCGSGTNVTHPYLEIVPTLNVELTAKPPKAVYDGKNSVIFRTDRWSMSADPNAPLYNSSALAITSVFAKPDGHIVDADMEINVAFSGDFPVGMNFANLDDMNAMPNLTIVYDLQNTLTHEFGHFIGLDHTCFIEDPSNPFATPPLDNEGNPAPSCDLASDEIRGTVMFASTGSRELSKRALSSDEILAVCEIYPEADDPKQCALDIPNDGIGCAVGEGRTHAAASLAAASLAAALCLRGRGRRRGRGPGR